MKTLQMNKTEIEKQLKKLKKYSGCAEISYKTIYVNTEPIKLQLQTVTHQKEVFRHDINLSALLRMSDFMLKQFAKNYLS